MYKIIAIMGEAGTGKDSLMQEILKLQPEFHEIISCTTRPKRQGEVEGVNYYYYTPEQFGDRVLHDEMLECTVFNDWFYGTSFELAEPYGVVLVMSPWNYPFLLTIDPLADAIAAKTAAVPPPTTTKSNDPALFGAVGKPKSCFRSSLQLCRSFCGAEAA